MADYISEEGVAALRAMVGPAGRRVVEEGLHAAAPEPSLDDRLRKSRHYLPGVLEAIFPGDTNRQQLAARAHALATEALRVIDGGPGDAMAPVEVLAEGLEVVVHTDGSRPSYLVRDDRVIQATAAPAAEFLAPLAAAANALPEVLQAIGRVNRGLLSQHTGTGWLIAPDVILTNRHVAEFLIDEDENGIPRVRDGAVPRIDFGHEHVADGSGQASRWRRKLTELLFLGQPKGDPNALDAALFRLGPGDGPAKPVPIARSKPGLGTMIAASGYPGAPDPSDPRAKIISALFTGLWGVKRLAPGFVTGGITGQVFHDASTLGGNSGSPVLTLAPIRGVALHFGGLLDNSRNTAQALGQVLKVPGRAGLPFTSLDAAFAALGADIT